MGYTNYWRQKRSFTDDEWKVIVARFTLYCLNSGELKPTQDGGLKIQNEDWTHKTLAGNLGDQGSFPSIEDEWITFNGVEQMSHETMHLSKHKRTRYHYEESYESEDAPRFNFCKTAGKPYDRFVVELLKAAKETAPDAIGISSDGGYAVFGELSDNDEVGYE